MRPGGEVLEVFEQADEDGFVPGLCTETKAGINPLVTHPVKVLEGEVERHSVHLVQCEAKVGQP